MIQTTLHRHIPFPQTYAGPCLNMNTVSPRYGDFHVKEKMHRLILQMGSPLLVEHLHIEMAPRTLSDLYKKACN